jgi:hypothetical protein
MFRPNTSSDTLNETRFYHDTAPVMCICYILSSILINKSDWTDFFYLRDDWSVQEQERIAP